jgi:hypothetical protein
MPYGVNMKPKLVLLVLILALFACNTRYAYRAKVKVNNSKSIVKKETSAPAHSTIEASAAEHYYPIPDDKLKNAETSTNSLTTHKKIKHPTLKKALLTLKHTLNDSTDLTTQVPASVKKKNTWLAVSFAALAIAYNLLLYNTIGLNIMVAIINAFLLVEAFTNFQKAATYTPLAKGAKKKKIKWALIFTSIGSIILVALNVMTGTSILLTPDSNTINVWWLIAGFFIAWAQAKIKNVLDVNYQTEEDVLAEKRNSSPAKLNKEQRFLLTALIVVSVLLLIILGIILLNANAATGR